MKQLMMLLLVLCSMYSFGQKRTLGVLQNDSASFNGYTLFAPSNSIFTFLIDNCGQVVNTWESRYPPGISAYLLEDGSLLRTARTNSNFNGGGSGGRVERYDWNNKLTWGYTYSSSTYHQHHDIEYLPNGNILLLAWEYHTPEEAIAMGRPEEWTPINGLWSEHIVELQPSGINQATVVWQWRTWDHLIQNIDSTKANYGQIAEHPELINLNFEVGPINRPSIDWLHLNSIDYHPEFDQIIVSSRTWGEFWVIDHSTTTEEAASHEGGRYGKGGDILYRWGNPAAYDRGSYVDQKLFGQHDVQWIPEGLPNAGKILIFNNGDGRLDGAYSTVDMLVPPVDALGHYRSSSTNPFEPNRLYWNYTAPTPNQFYAPRISGAQALPNGNILICEGTEGHFFEVDSLGTMVWEYINPLAREQAQMQGDEPKQNDVFRAYRYGTDYPPFQELTLTPGLPIEIDTLPLPCDIIEEVVEIVPGISVDTGLDFAVYPNPVQASLFIENTSNSPIHVQIFDATGRLVQDFQNVPPSFSLPTQQWQKGLYIIRIHDITKETYYTRKIVK